MRHFIVNHDTERDGHKTDRVHFKYFCKQYKMMTEDKKSELKQLLKEQKWDEFKKVLSGE